MSIGSQPRFRLATLPTPLQEAARLREALGGAARSPRILIKRDDLTGLALGGNKAPKLEFLVGDALRAEEPEALRERYGRTSLGHGALLARRLVEAGVRFVTVSRGFNTWDHHKDIFPLLSNDFLPELDRAYATLLDDLNQRGMLGSTLVIATGEFGRTPEINAMGGRDHWPNAFSMTLAGAGITGGRVWGESDEKGMFVKNHPVEVPDITATIYRKLGINHEKEYMSNIGRPIRLSQGKPLDFLT